jgi:hypothetical protein
MSSRVKVELYILILFLLIFSFDDYFVWKSILQANKFHARAVVIEFNYVIPSNENRVIKPDQDSRRFTGTVHFGAGIRALWALARVHGYTLIYGEKMGVNLFFVQTSILHQQGILDKVPSVEKLHVGVPAIPWTHRPETDKSRLWIWNDTAW